MIRGRAAAGDSHPVSSLAARPQVIRALRRATFGVGAAGVACAAFASLGGSLMDAAASAAVSGGGSYGSTQTDPTVAGLSASAPVEIAGLDAPVQPDANAIQGIVGAPTTSTTVTTAPVATVPRAPQPPPAPGSVEAIIAEVFGSHASEAIAVARCESHLNPAAISRGGGNWGLFQINTAHRSRVARMGYAWEDLLDARVNALVARSIFVEQGWSPWACRRALR